jgi:hypothetical protein
MNRLVAIAALFVMAANISFAAQMLQPYKMEVSDGQVIDFGEVGPGQTVSIEMDGRPTSGGTFGLGGTYEILNASALPDGWTATASDWAGNPLQVKIKSNKYAPEGDYVVKVQMLDDIAEGLPNITFSVKFRITHAVLSASLDSARKEVLAGQPARFYITVENLANTADTYVVRAENAPGWNFKKYIYIPARSSATVAYEIVGAEEGEFSPVISVETDSSPLIKRTMNATVVVGSSLAADFKAVNNGMLFFPAMNSAIYALAGLISNFF